MRDSAPWPVEALRLLLPLPQMLTRWHERLRLIYLLWHGIDPALARCRFGHQAFTSAPARPTAASRGAAARWTLQHPINRWALMGTYHNPSTGVERWLERMIP